MNCYMFRPTMWALQGRKIQRFDALRLRNVIKKLAEQIRMRNLKN